MIFLNRLYARSASPLSTGIVMTPRRAMSPTPPPRIVGVAAAAVAVVPHEPTAARRDRAPSALDDDADDDIARLATATTTRSRNIATERPPPSSTARRRTRRARASNSIARRSRVRVGFRLGFTRHPAPARPRRPVPCSQVSMQCARFCIHTSHCVRTRRPRPRCPPRVDVASSRPRSSTVTRRSSRATTVSRATRRRRRCERSVSTRVEARVEAAAAEEDERARRGWRSVEGRAKRRRRRRPPRARGR